MPSLRLGLWPRFPTRYGTGTESWLRPRWSTRSCRASRRESWHELRSPTTWDRTPPSSTRSAERTNPHDSAHPAHRLPAGRLRRTRREHQLGPRATAGRTGHRPGRAATRGDRLTHLRGNALHDLARRGTRRRAVWPPYSTTASASAGCLRGHAHHHPVGDLVSQEICQLVRDKHDLGTDRRRGQVRRALFQSRSKRSESA